MCKDHIGRNISLQKLGVGSGTATVYSFSTEYVILTSLGTCYRDDSACSKPYDDIFRIPTQTYIDAYGHPNGRRRRTKRNIHGSRDDGGRSRRSNHTSRF